jgi:AcrR family transcriptional regulator
METRTALVEVAARLLRDGGAGAVTTRAVAAAAGVQAPTLYRLFGDKDGLLDAVAEHTLATYVATKAVDEDDPLDALRRGWAAHVDFGLANPAVFALLCDPRRAASPAAAAGLEVLRARVHRVAATGRLRVPERRAVELIHAAGTGVILTQLATPPDRRDPDLPAAMLESLLRTLLTDTPAPPAGPAAAAVTLRAADLPSLTPAERTLLTEWLDRITTG